MDETALIEAINGFDRWHYQFDLDGHLTPIHDESKINRHVQRKRYFFDPLVTLLGESLAGKRVLDLGCNAGFWSLHAIESGCDFVLGIDGREMHIDQASLVFDVKGVPKDRYRFVQANIFETDFAALGKFDVVLCLGLLYHVGKPIELMERIAEVGSDIVVVDTHLSSVSGSCLEIIHESLEDPRSAVDRELVLWPTRQAVRDMVQLFGYEARMLKPRFDDYTGARDYREGHRRAFLCASQTDLSTLQAPVQSVPKTTRKSRLRRLLRG
jgi:SAM-dependent methyltransferase